MKYDFKPFQKVLVRDVSAGDGWRASFFSHYRHGKPVTVNGWEFSQMIPYEGNESLLGTKDEPEPELKKGDIVAVWDANPAAKRVRVYSHRSKHGGHYVFTTTDTIDVWDHAEKFAPAAVEDEAAT